MSKEVTPDATRVDEATTRTCMDKQRARFQDEETADEKQEMSSHTQPCNAKDDDSAFPSFCKKWSWLCMIVVALGILALLIVAIAAGRRQIDKENHVRQRGID